MKKVKEIRLVANYICAIENIIYVDKNPYDYFRVGDIITFNDGDDEYHIQGILTKDNVFRLKIIPYYCKGKDQCCGSIINRKEIFISAKEIIRFNSCYKMDKR